MKGIGSTSLELETCGSIHLNNFLYVPDLKKNFLSISFLEDKSDRIVFVDGKVVVLGKGSSIYDSMVIGIRKGISYIQYTHLAQDLVHMNFNKVWMVGI